MIRVIDKKASWLARIDLVSGFDSGTARNSPCKLAQRRALNRAPFPRAGARGPIEAGSRSAEAGAFCRFHVQERVAPLKCYSKPQKGRKVGPHICACSFAETVGQAALTRGQAEVEFRRGL